MLKAGERVMRAIALSLNLPLNYFESTFNDSFWVKFFLLILYKYRFFLFLGYSMYSLSSYI
jgi:isopenicillin N synthase-like dioxygenase